MSSISRVFIAALAVSIIVVASIASNAEELRRVEVHAQPRPGEPAEDIKMRVHPAPTELNIVPADSINLPKGDIVVGVIHMGVVIAYPVRFLGHREIASTVINGLPIAPSWCSITGSAVVYNREVDGQLLTFDFGEGLINNNLLFVDRETGSVWSQLHAKAIAGPLKGTPLEVLPAMQMTWRHWRTLHPETWVWLPEGNGHPYYYRDFEPGHDPPPFERRHDMSRLGLGLRYKDSTMFFPFSELENARVPLFVVFGDQKVAVYYSERGRSAWVIDEALEVVPTVLIYDWAWAGFYPDTGIYREDGQF